MKKIFLKSLVLIGISLSAIYGMDNKEYLIEHGFINENQEDVSTSISSEFNILPKPTGPYQIGVKIYDLIDENRDNRLIPVWIFFPTEKGIHNTYPKISENRALDLWEAINLWNQLNVNVHSNLIDNLDFLKKSSKHPVIIFNNGNGMLCSDNAFLIEDLVSHGYIVVSIQNQINTDKLISAKFTKGSFENYNTVIRNNLYVFDWLKTNNKTIFYNALDLSRIGIIGYSMGANSLMLWADKASRDSTKKHFLFPHETPDAKECIVSLDARRIAFPFINNTPIFMLISSERKDEQILNGEYDLIQKIGHRFKYYNNTHHGSFSDQAYFNTESPLSPEMGWYYGSSEDRMQFFDEMRKDIRDFLEEKISKFSNLDGQTFTQKNGDILNHIKYQVPHILQNDDYSCATTSLALAITYFENLDKSLDEEFVWKISGTDQKDVHK